MDIAPPEAVQPEDAKARMLANLRPPWKPGQTGNPNGRRSYERSFREYLMDIAPKTEDDLKKIRRDRALPMLQRKAAETILKLKADGMSILDFIEQVWGKPSQQINVDWQASLSDETKARLDQLAAQLAARLE